MEGDEGQQEEPAQPQGRPAPPPAPYAPTVVLSGPEAADLIARKMITVKAFPGTPVVGTPTVGTSGSVHDDQKPIAPAKSTSTAAVVAKAGDAAVSSAPVAVAPQAPMPVVPALPKAPVPPLPSAPTVTSSAIPSLPAAPAPKASEKHQEDLLDPDEDVGAAT